MNNFKTIRTLASNPRFTLFEAKLSGSPVVLKQCVTSKVAEVEFFVRSALLKVRDKVYKNPLLMIFADTDPNKEKLVVSFVWKKGKTMDREVERDRESEFPSGDAGYGEPKVMYMNPHTKVLVEKVLCRTLGKKVVRKVSTHIDIAGLNETFTEALALVSCAHPNICGLLDFRLFQSKKGHHCAYIVMEKLKIDLATEVEERKVLGRPYEEEELLSVLLDVSAALIHAKSANLAHGDIKPSNILRGPQGLKLADFGSIWRKGLLSETGSAAGTRLYMSPEALRTLGNPSLLQRPFESDVFSFGMTLLHLAALKLPSRTGDLTDSELQALLQREVTALSYSDGFKRLLAAMLSVDARERQPLESVREEVISLTRQALRRQKPLQLQATMTNSASLDTLSSKSKRDALQQSQKLNGRKPQEMSVTKTPGAALKKQPPARMNDATRKNQESQKEMASQLHQRADSNCNDGNYAEAIKSYAAADQIYSRDFPTDEATADNIFSWGVALINMDKFEEAAVKYEAASGIYSGCSSKSAADNLYYWGVALTNMSSFEKAAEKYAAADAIYSCGFPESKSAADNLYYWGSALGKLRNFEEAVKKYAAANSFYSRYFPNDIHAAGSLYFWGIALSNMKNLEKAVKKYAAADAIYSRNFPSDKDTASNLFYWGIALSSMRHFEEAVKKYAAADVIYSRHFPIDKDTANNFRFWARALLHLSNEQAARSKFVAARAIYASNGKISCVQECDQEIAKLR